MSEKEEFKLPEIKEKGTFEEALGIENKRMMELLDLCKDKFINLNRGDKMPSTRTGIIKEMIQFAKNPNELVFLSYSAGKFQALLDRKEKERLNLKEDNADSFFKRNFM